MSGGTRAMGHTVYPGLTLGTVKGAFITLAVGIVWILSAQLIVLLNNWKLKKLGYSVPQSRNYN